MGGDGGVIATQRKFVRGAKLEDDKDESKNIKQQQITRAGTCAISGEVSDSTLLYVHCTIIFCLLRIVMKRLSV